MYVLHLHSNPAYLNAAAEGCAKGVADNFKQFCGDTEAALMATVNMFGLTTKDAEAFQEKFDSELQRLGAGALVKDAIFTQEEVNARVVGALYKFVGELTTNHDAVHASKYHDAAPLADRVSNFIKRVGLTNVEPNFAPFIVAEALVG